MRGEHLLDAKTVPGTSAFSNIGEDFDIHGEKCFQQNLVDTLDGGHFFIDKNDKRVPADIRTLGVKQREWEKSKSEFDVPANIGP